MPFSSKRFLALASAILLSLAPVLAQGPKPVASGPDLNFSTVLYGAAYYNEYMPGDDADHAARLDKDVALMRAAGLNVVRMESRRGACGSRKTDASSTRGWTVWWTRWQGRHQGYPGHATYSIPAWMAHQHAEILADRIPGGMFGGQPVAFLTAFARTWTRTRPRTGFYAERLIRHIVAHYKDNRPSSAAARQ